MKRKLPGLTFVFDPADVTNCIGAQVLLTDFTKTGELAAFLTGRLTGLLADGRPFAEWRKHDNSIGTGAFDLAIRPDQLERFLQSPNIAFSPRLRAQLRARGIKVPR